MFQWVYLSMVMGTVIQASLVVHKTPIVNSSLENCYLCNLDSDWPLHSGSLGYIRVGLALVSSLQLHTA